MTVTQTKTETLSKALSLLWQANVVLYEGPSDRLLDALQQDVMELARKVESYRNAEVERITLAETR